MSSSTVPVITRFAPSPTGFLHIGGARTALFNWLFAKHHNGQFKLRIEDTDRARSTKEAMDAIEQGMTWLGLLPDGEIVYQFSRAERHREVAHHLLAEGKAYKCYATPEELDMMRTTAKAEGRPMRYDGRWRDRPESDAPANQPYVIRLKAPLEGETTLTDLVQGPVTVAHSQLDDMVLVRADGTPTYMLAVVVDDYDMGVTHVIRGDDHLNNAFRQRIIYQHMNWALPQYAHIPLIHGADGAKMSKRHGALGVEAYQQMGYLPEGLKNYLLRLGWSHGDDEIIPVDKAIEWFNLDHVGKAASKFDLEKLNYLNAHYLKQADTATLIQECLTRLGARVTCSTEEAHRRLWEGLPALVERSKTLVDLAEAAAFYLTSVPLEITEKAQKHLTPESLGHLAALCTEFENTTQWQTDKLKQVIQEYAQQHELKMGKIGPPLRAASCGTLSAPDLFDVLTVLGKEETLLRLKAQFA